MYGFPVYRERGTKLTLVQYSANQFNFQTGAIIGQDLPKDTYKLLDRNNKQLWSTPIVEDAWQNFAITIDFEEEYVFPIPSSPAFSTAPSCSFSTSAYSSPPLHNKH
jgi:hypothetical protein